MMQMYGKEIPLRGGVSIIIIFYSSLKIKGQKGKYGIHFVSEPISPGLI